MNKFLTTIFFILFIIYTSVSAQDNFLGNIRYNIVPVSHGLGGGLTMGNIDDNFTCPSIVVQEQLDVDKGLPVTFTSWNPKSLVVGLSTDATIEFSAYTLCMNSNMWRIQWDETIERYVIATNGGGGAQTEETIGDWFKIERYGTDYKIVYCPTYCATCRPVCGDIGVFVRNEQRILVVNEKSTDLPLIVTIQEVNEVADT